MSLNTLQDEVIQIIQERKENQKLKNRLRVFWRKVRSIMTSAKYLPQIDSIYVYNVKRDIPFTHRAQPEAGYRYKNRNVLLQSKENEIHLYHQSVEIDGVLKAITMVTMDDNKKRVEKFFKDAVKVLKGDEKRLAVFNVASKPVQLDILHLY